MKILTRSKWGDFNYPNLPQLPQSFLRAFLRAFLCPSAKANVVRFGSGPNFLNSSSSPAAFRTAATVTLVHPARYRLRVKSWIALRVRERPGGGMPYRSILSDFVTGLLNGATE